MIPLKKSGLFLCSNCSYWSTTTHTTTTITTTNAAAAAGTTERWPSAANCVIVSKDQNRSRWQTWTWRSLSRAILPSSRSKSSVHAGANRGVIMGPTLSFCRCQKNERVNINRPKVILFLLSYRRIMSYLKAQHVVDEPAESRDTHRVSSSIELLEQIAH